MEWLAGIIGALIAGSAVIAGSLLAARASARTEKQRLEAEERRLRLQLDADRRRMAEQRLFQHRLDAVLAVDSSIQAVRDVALSPTDPDNYVEASRRAMQTLVDAIGLAILVFPPHIEEMANEISEAGFSLIRIPVVVNDDKFKDAVLGVAQTARNEFVRAARDVLITSSDPQPG